MDETLIRDTRAVKRRRHIQHPTLWLFTDAARLADPLPAIARLPRDIAGVVFRHDNAPNRIALGQAIARLCRARRLALVVAGDARLAAALRAGLHLRRGRQESHRKSPAFHRRLVTASAHDFSELQQALRARADLVFLSPAFATATHSDRPWLGALRWTILAKSSRIQTLALGGVEGRRLRTLGPYCSGAGAIGALTIGQ
jgi:thiamine-phosphate pyrophosphorylase